MQSVENVQQQNDQGSTGKFENDSNTFGVVDVGIQGLILLLEALVGIEKSTVLGDQVTIHLRKRGHVGFCRFSSFLFRRRSICII